MRYRFFASGLFWLLVHSGCGVVPYALTEEEAMNHFHLVNAENKFAQKRLRANQRYHHPSPLSDFLRWRPAPDFFYEYKQSDGRKGIRLYYVSTDSVFVFEEAKRNDITPNLVTVRSLTANELAVYNVLHSSGRVEVLMADSLRPAADSGRTASQPIPVTAYLPTRSKKDSAFYLDNVAITISHRWRTVNNKALNRWFVPQGYDPVRQHRLGDLSLSGLVSGAGLYELQFSGSVFPSSITTFFMGLGFYPELAAKGRLGLYGGLSASYLYHQDFGIGRYVPPALQVYVGGVRPDDRHLLELKQQGFSIQPEIRGIYHLGRKADNNFSFFAGAGIGFDVTSRWRLTYNQFLEPPPELLARPPIPSVSRQWLFARVGLLFKFRLKD